MPFTTTSFSLLRELTCFARNKGTVDGGSTVGSSAGKEVGRRGSGSRGGMPTHSPSSWKEEELLLKIDGEIKARNPNLEVKEREASIYTVIHQSMLKVE